MLSGLMSRWTIPELVRRVQRPRDQPHDVERRAVRHPLDAAEPAPQALALEVLHDDVRLAIRQEPEVEHLDDAGCRIEAAERASLKNRVTMSRLLEIAGCSTFTAAARPRDSWTMRYTAPIPPSPMVAVTW